MSEVYRIEKDSLGEVRVSVNAYWGAQTQRAVYNFPISGLKQYPAFIWGMAIIKRAAAEVNNDLGLFEDKEIGQQVIPGGDMAKAIMQAADEVLDGRFPLPIRSRPYPGRGRHQPQYERQRSHRQPRQRDIGLWIGYKYKTDQSQ
jgi:aspartate ammonia-lyase